MGQRHSKGNRRYAVVGFGRPLAADAQKHFDTLGLALGDIFFERLAALQQTRLVAILVVVLTTAVCRKASSRVSRRIIMLGAAGDKRQ